MKAAYGNLRSGDRLLNPAKHHIEEVSFVREKLDNRRFSCVNILNLGGILHDSLRRD